MCTIENLEDLCKGLLEAASVVMVPLAQSRGRGAWVSTRMGAHKKKWTCHTPLALEEGVAPSAPTRHRTGGRGGAPGYSSWPWLASAGPPGRAAPDDPGTAPYAGVAWTAGALVRVGSRHCAGRGQAPARAWCRWGDYGRCPLSEGRCASSDPLWLRRSGPQKACGPQLCRHLPQGRSRCRASSKTRSPYAAVNAAIACESARPAERPRQPYLTVRIPGPS